MSPSQIYILYNKSKKRENKFPRRLIAGDYGVSKFYDFICSTYLKPITKFSTGNINIECKHPILSLYEMVDDITKKNKLVFCVGKNDNCYFMGLGDQILEFDSWDETELSFNYSIMFNIVLPFEVLKETFLKVDKSRTQVRLRLTKKC